MPESAMPQRPPPPRSFLGNIGIVWQQRRKIWQLLSRADKLAFALSVLITAVVSYIQIQIALLVGDFFNRALKLTGQPAALSTFATRVLAFFGGFFLFN